MAARWLVVSLPGETVAGLRSGKGPLGPLKLVADRLSLPTNGGSFKRFADYLPPKLRRAFLRPKCLRVPGAPRPKSGKVHAERQEWLKFLGRLLAAGMLRLVDPAKTTHVDGKQVWNGFFAVPKDEDHERTICNRVAQNSLE